MVSFTCNACGQTVKKNKVEKHWQVECPGCSVLSCLDCGKDFAGDAYAAHTSCISEAEKYQGKFYTAPSGNTPKGQRKQDEWLEKLQAAAERSEVRPQLRSLLQQISDYPNVPRKKAKFQNFVRNSLRVTRQPLLDELWDIFSNISDSSKQDVPAEARGSVAKTAAVPEDSTPAKGKPSDRKRNHDGDREDEDLSKNKKKKKTPEKNEDRNGVPSELTKEENEKESFGWKSCIAQTASDLAQKYPDGVPVKKLRKKVLSARQAQVGGDCRTEEQLQALFQKKLAKATLVSVENNLVRLK